MPFESNPVIQSRVFKELPVRRYEDEGILICLVLQCNDGEMEIVAF